MQWYFNQNTKRFIHKNESEIIVNEMTVILSGGGEWGVTKST